MSSPSQPEVISLGCRLNIAESETIRALLGDRDVVVVNSCAVTNSAVKQSRAAIRKARRLRPGALLAVTGCAAQIDPASFAAMPEVDRVIGNSDKLLPDAWASAAPLVIRDMARVTEIAPHLAVACGQSRAFVEVQNGCDHRCTFCAIPFGRGPSRSAPAGAVIEAIERVVASGKNEVVLTGVDLTSYGADLPGQPTLGSLVERVLTLVPTLPRLRLSSIDAPEIDDRLFALLTQEARVMPHLHLSLQAGDDMILKRMKRRHSRADAVRLVERLKTARPEIAIGADLIAGFPTEDAAMAANSLALIDDCDIVHAHIFPYSPRAGTPAARMPQVEPEVARERAARLREAAAARKTAWLNNLVGTAQQILVEAPGDQGHAPNFAHVRLLNPVRAELVEARAAATRPSTGSGRAVGDVMRVEITGTIGNHLIGTPA
ncbi:tRNA (N(6)-L-threonylcarbamoyladenosine(37)-C(2))-methylthiotransferase MtaB [Sphingomonas bacterium]|uniref:tRNA (N(6)-L-threonylcarbamoyladenosine(37)-C(2))- methylthiotransferase MtaB n=1 Tax=Sphingomonas bacterium TaxID=1895847 RepID=UPI00260CD005|nr:tRNA (N(6)-L-threonylcarbamoyladenosine(37)-C(2))-methylthiotransferase MtaB [Sphingomonas bacterium]MDB5678079.1 2-methylthioadenine synthase [Sphingomonas bacterium]